jgi:hypothetical protein
VGNNGCATATNILGHANACVFDLIGARFAGQLLHGFDNLLDTRRAHRMAATFETAHGADG